MPPQFSLSFTFLSLGPTLFQSEKKEIQIDNFPQSGEKSLPIRGGECFQETVNTTFAYPDGTIMEVKPDEAGSKCIILLYPSIHFLVNDGLHIRTAPHSN